MSRGPGRIERAIEDALITEPSRSFSVEELATVVYPGINRVEKKHRVAVLRAAGRVAARLHWRGRTAERLGGAVIFGNLLDVRSYALRQLRTDHVWGGEPIERLEAMLGTGKHAERVAPGGAWHQHVEIHRAEAEGDEVRGDELRRLLTASVLDNTHG